MLDKDVPTRQGGLVKTNIFLLLSASIIVAMMLRAGADIPEPPKPETKKPDIRQKNVEAENGPIFEDDYEKALSHGERNVLVIFGADWCKYCRVLKGDIPSMNLKGYVVCIVDVTKNKAISNQNKVSSLPTSIVVNNRKEVSRTVGYSAQKYGDWLDKNRRLAK